MPKPRDLHALYERAEEYGRAINAGFTAGTASAVCLQANRHRKRATFVNDSDTTLYLAKGPTAALNTGIRLNANGGSYIEECDALGYLWVGQFAVISSAATKVLCIVEEV